MFLDPWILVCLKLDDFLSRKQQEAHEYGLNDSEKVKFINKWLLYLFSKPTDTLVITLNNLESKLAKQLIEVFEENPSVEFIK
jgi:hypothetical protein